jgi:glycosyltransferase involved in cell wall biosynthesis
MQELSPAVSVVICAYNAEHYLSRSIESILNQTYKNLEVVVVDDASTDYTTSVAEEWAGKDKRVSLVKQKVNGGLANTRMTGLANTKYELIVYIDADDVALPSMLEKQVAAMHSDTNVLGVATYAYYIGQEETDILGVQKIGPKSKEEYFYLYNNNKLVFLPATTLCRKSDVLAAGGFRVEGFSLEDGIRYQDYCDDLDLWCRMSDLSNTGRYFITVPEPLFLYRKNTNSLSAKNVFAMQNKMRWIKDCLKRRRGGLPERDLNEFQQSASAMQKFSNYRSDYAALIYKKAGFCVLRGQYLRAVPLFTGVCLLNPRLVIQKLKTQSRTLRT